MTPRWTKKSKWNIHGNDPDCMGDGPPLWWLGVKLLVALAILGTLVLIGAPH